MCGKQDHLQNLENLVYECTGPIVQSTISMQSMLMLGGSGGMPSQIGVLKLNLGAFQGLS